MEGEEKLLVWSLKLSRVVTVSHCEREKKVEGKSAGSFDAASVFFALDCC
jgi:hypothetical protein